MQNCEKKKKKNIQRRNLVCCLIVPKFWMFVWSCLLFLSLSDSSEFSECLSKFVWFFWTCLNFGLKVWIWSECVWILWVSLNLCLNFPDFFWFLFKPYKIGFLTCLNMSECLTFGLNVADFSDFVWTYMNFGLNVSEISWCLSDLSDFVWMLVWHCLTFWCVWICLAFLSDIGWPVEFVCKCGSATRKQELNYCLQRHDYNLNSWQI